MASTTTAIYLTRGEAMARLGYRSLDTWYDHLKAGFIAGVERRGKGKKPRYFYRAADLRFVGAVEPLRTVEDREAEDRLARVAAARRGRFANPFLASSRAVA